MVRCDPMPSREDDEEMFSFNIIMFWGGPWWGNQGNQGLKPRQDSKIIIPVAQHGMTKPEHVFSETLAY